MSNNFDIIDNNDIEDQLIQEALQYLIQLTEDTPKRGGSVPGRRYVNRNRAAGHERLFNDYFSDDPVYTDQQFRRRFRMKRDLFLEIVEAVRLKDEYFTQKPDAAGKPGLSPIQKVTAAMRQLAYGVSSDSVDEYIRLADSTAMESLKHFCHAIVAIYGDEYLRAPNSEDVKNLLAINEERGFPGMLGSIDCMHWTWKNCPTTWHGMYTGKEKMPTLILEAVASQDLWIWHCFFGLPGSLNDINVINRSHVFDPLIHGVAPEVEFFVNGNRYDKGYFLADGIYPTWSTLVKTIAVPTSQKEKVPRVTKIIYKKLIYLDFNSVLLRHKKVCERT